MKEIYNSKHINDHLKIKTFNTYSASIFLYNSETWAIDKSIEDIVNKFQRKQIRHILKIYYPKIIRNEDIYNKYKIEPWNITIKRRRLKFIGHILRLNYQTPARKAITECFSEYKLKRGRPKTTWVRTIHNDFKDIINYNTNTEFLRKLTEIAEDRNRYNLTIKRLMGSDDPEGA